MPKDQREVETGLINKGFKRREGDHSYFVYESADGKKARAFTKTSHGRGIDIDDHLLSQMARQCGLTRQEFVRLTECPLSREEYEAILRSRNRL